MRRILLAVAVLLAACGGDDDGGDEATGDEASTTTAAADETATTTPSTTTTTTTSEAEEPEGPIVTLRAGALDAGGNELAFGEAAQDDTVTALTAALGDPTDEQDLTECGEGPLHSVRFPSIVVYFADGTLGGWHLQPTGPVVLTTADGIGIGSTRADLEASFADLAVEETSLGIEFTAGPEPGPYLSGTLVDDGPDGEIDAMWSGMVCIAR